MQGNSAPPRRYVNQSSRRASSVGASEQANPPASPIQSANAATAKATLLAFLQGNTGALLGVIHSYTLRLGLAQGAPPEDARALARDILQEVAAEALDHADRFDPTRQPMAWLLGVALNVIRRRRAAQAQRLRRELPLGGLPISGDDSGPGEPQAAGPRATYLAIPGPEQAVEADDEARALLALVADDDRRVLQLALLDDLDGEALARALGVSVGAARMRLHRALGRLRAAWVARQAHATPNTPDAKSITQPTIGPDGGPDGGPERSAQ